MAIGLGVAPAVTIRRDLSAIHRRRGRAAPPFRPKRSLHGFRRGNLRLSEHFGQVPRYYFHLRDDLSVDDEEGLELSNLDAARARAERYARAMTAASVLERGRINFNHRIEVTDEAGQNVLVVTFGDAVAIES